MWVYKIITFFLLKINFKNKHHLSYAVPTLWNMKFFFILYSLKHASFLFQMINVWMHACFNSKQITSKQKSQYTCHMIKKNISFLISDILTNHRPLKNLLKYRNISVAWRTHKIYTKHNTTSKQHKKASIDL